MLETDNEINKYRYIVFGTGTILIAYLDNHNLKFYQQKVATRNNNCLDKVLSQQYSEPPFGIKVLDQPVYRISHQLSLFLNNQFILPGWGGEHASLMAMFPSEEKTITLVSKPVKPSHYSWGMDSSSQEFGDTSREVETMPVKKQHSLKAKDKCWEDEIKRVWGMVVSNKICGIDELGYEIPEELYVEEGSENTGGLLKFPKPETPDFKVHDLKSERKRRFSFSVEEKKKTGGSDLKKRRNSSFKEVSAKSKSGVGKGIKMIKVKTDDDLEEKSAELMNDLQEHLAMQVARLKEEKLGKADLVREVKVLKKQRESNEKEIRSLKDKLKEESDERRKQSLEYANDLQSKSMVIEPLQKKSQELDLLKPQVTQLKTKIDNRERHIQSLQSEVKQKSLEMERLARIKNQEVHEANGKLRNLQTASRRREFEQNAAIEQLKNTNSELQQANASLLRDCEIFKQAHGEAIRAHGESHYSCMQQMIGDTKNQLAVKDKRITELEALCRKADKEAQSLRKKLSSKDASHISNPGADNPRYELVRHRGDPRLKSSGSYQSFYTSVSSEAEELPPPPPPSTPHPSSSTFIPNIPKPKGTPFFYIDTQALDTNYPSK